MHEIRFEIFDLKEEKVDGQTYRERISAAKEEYNCFGFGRAVNTHKTFESAEEAKKHLRECWSKDVDCSYYCTYKLKRSSKYVTLKNRLSAEEEKLIEYRKAHSCSGFKAALVSCDRCTSKINKRYIKNDTCPVCGNDLRSKTTVETIHRYEANIQQLKKDIFAEEKVMQAGRASKNDTLGTMYLLSIDTHV